MQAREYRRITHASQAQDCAPYFERATLLIKRAVLLLLIRPYLIATQYMIADIFTKALPRDNYTKLRGQLMNLHSPLRTSIENGMLGMTGRMRRLAQHMFVSR